MKKSCLVLAAGDGTRMKSKTKGTLYCLRQAYGVGA